MYKLSAVFIGLLIAVMVTFNGTLAAYVGDYLSVLIVQIVGLIAVGIILIGRKKKISLKSGVPTYLLFAGGIGVVLTFFNNICFKHLGVSLTLALGLFGQSLAAVIIDHFGFFGLDVHKFQKEKIIGFMIVLAGIVIMVIY